MAAATGVKHEIETLHEARHAESHGTETRGAETHHGAHADESVTLQTGLHDQVAIDAIYRQVFGRHADQETLDYYAGKLHETTPDALIRSILSSAHGNELIRSDATGADAEFHATIDQLGSPQIDALVEQYKAALHTESATDHSGASSSGDATHDQALQTHAETRDHVTLVGVSDGTHSVDFVSV